MPTRRRKGGRPRKVDNADAAKARQLREKGITATDIAKMLGVSRATMYRYLSDGASLLASPLFATERDEVEHVVESPRQGELIGVEVGLFERQAFAVALGDAHQQDQGADL